MALLIKYGAEVVPATKEEGSKVPSRSHSIDSRRTSPAGEAHPRNKPQQNLWSTSLTTAARSIDTDVTRTSSPPVRAATPTSAAFAKLLASRSARLIRRSSQDSTGAPLRIVLPQENVRLTSMPLSPSALGFATTRRLPVLSNLHAKSLDKELVFTRKTPSPQTNSSAELTSRNRKTPSPPSGDITTTSPSTSSATQVTTSQQACHQLPPVTFAVPRVTTALASGEKPRQLLTSLDVDIARKRRKFVNFDAKTDATGSIDRNPVTSPDNTACTSPQAKVSTASTATSGDTNGVVSQDGDVSKPENGCHDDRKRKLRRKTTESESSVELSEGLCDSPPPPDGDVSRTEQPSSSASPKSSVSSPVVVETSDKASSATSAVS